MKYNEIKDIFNGKYIVFDGAMGTQLQNRGLLPGEIPEQWNISRSDDILDIHRAYVAAGCDVLKTNTFGANPIKLNGAGAGDMLDAAVKQGIALARRAANEATDRRVMVAHSIGPIGKLLKPIGELEFEEAVECFKGAIRASEGADFILFETFSDTYEMKAALLAAKETATVPYAVTVMLDASGRLLTGGDAGAVAVLARSLGAFAVGLNCGQGPDIMCGLLPELMKYCAYCDLPVIVNSNAGLPRTENGKTVYDISSDEFAAKSMELIALGASAVGGCCGTTPEHIAKVASLVKNTPRAAKPAVCEKHTYISSYNHALDIAARPVIIGERVNPTGKPRLREALKAGDLGYLCREAIAQSDKGAQVLDVNVGLPEINEAQMLTLAVSSIQAVCDLPLQIDTGNTDAMESALRIYNGRPLLNSVNGKASSMESVFPIAAKYGACVVCLCLDESGIPDSVEGRMAIARRIVAKAAEYGIEKCDLLFDALVMTVSTGADNAKITLDTLKCLKNELGVATVLGVSNVSFGLPERSRINSIFYTMALHTGLDAGIVNPLDENMLAAYRAYNALAAHDAMGLEYIGHYSGAAQTPAQPTAKEKTATRDPGEAIKLGLGEEAATATAKMLADGTSPVDMIDKVLVPALDEVGRGFEAKKVFLPQLLMSAEAAKCAFSVIKEHIAAKGSAAEAKGRIIIATVEGDIHDIGKNIVKALLENYGFDMIDLGKDVKCERIVEEAKARGVKLVALSALMTTTVPAMEKTVALLREEIPDCATMVGGAVLNEEYAQKMGATFYAKDAMASVRFALDYFG